MRDPVALMSPGERNSKRLRKCLHASRHVSPPPAAVSPCPTLRKIPAATLRESPYTCARGTCNERSYTVVMTRHSWYENTEKSNKFRIRIYIKLYAEILKFLKFSAIFQFLLFVLFFSFFFLFKTEFLHNGKKTTAGMHIKGTISKRPRRVKRVTHRTSWKPRTFLDPFACECDVS